MHTEGLNKASSRHRVEFSTLGPFLSKSSVDQRTNSLFSIYLPTHHIHPIQGILGSASSREAIEHNACMCVCVCVCVRAHALTHFSRVRLFATPWTVAHKAPLSMGFSRQKYWSAYHVLLQWIFLTQGSNPHLLHWQEGSLPLTPPAKPQSTEVRAKAGARHQFWAEISVQSLTSQGTSRYFLTETVPGFSICKMGIIRVPAGRLVVVSTI